MYDGPQTVDAENLMLSASTKWPADQGRSTTSVEFITKDWQVRFVQRVISQLKSGSEGSHTAESDED